MKYFYLAATQKTESGKYNSFVIRVYEYNNLINVLKQYGNIVNALICPTKKRAEELINMWNEQDKANETYSLF